MKRWLHGHVLYLVLILFLLAVSGTVTGVIFVRHREPSQSKSVNYNYGNFPHHTPATRAEEEQAADNYFIAHVGKENFQKYYRSTPEKTSWADPDISTFDFLAYHLTLFTKLYGVSGASAQVNRNNLNEIYGSVPPCVQMPNQCNPRLSFEQAKQVAWRYGLTGDLSARLTELPGNKNHVHTLLVESCNEKKALYIDYTTGKILKTDRGCIPVDL